MTDRPTPDVSRPPAFAASADAPVGPRTPDGLASGGGGALGADDAVDADDAIRCLSDPLACRARAGILLRSLAPAVAVAPPQVRPAAAAAAAASATPAETRPGDAGKRAA